MVDREVRVSVGRNMGKRVQQARQDAVIAEVGVCEPLLLGAADSRFVEHVARCEEMTAAQYLCVPESVLHGG